MTLHSHHTNEDNENLVNVCDYLRKFTGIKYENSCNNSIKTNSRNV